jgi:hypothetical protein
MALDPLTVCAAGICFLLAGLFLLIASPRRARAAGLLARTALLLAGLAALGLGLHLIDQAERRELDASAAALTAPTRPER